MTGANVPIYTWAIHIDTKVYIGVDSRANIALKESIDYTSNERMIECQFVRRQH